MVDGCITSREAKLAAVNDENGTTKSASLSFAISLPTWYLMLLFSCSLAVIFCIFDAPQKKYSSSIYGPDWIPSSKAAIMLHLVLCGAFKLARPAVSHTSCFWTNIVLILALMCSWIGLAMTTDTDATLDNMVGLAGLVVFAFFWTLVFLWVVAVTGEIFLAKSRRSSKATAPQNEQKLEKPTETSSPCSSATSPRLRRLVILAIASLVSWWGAWRLLQARNETRDNALQFVSSAYASSRSTTDTGGGPGLVLNKTRSETRAEQQLSAHAYSGWVVVQSYEIQNHGDVDDGSSFVCATTYSAERAKASIRVQLNTVWGGSWACPSTGADTSCETPVEIDFKCHDCFMRSGGSTMADCVESRFTPYNLNDDEDADDYVDYANFDPTTSEPDFYAMDGMYFIYGNCDTCEAHTSWWMREQAERLQLTHHMTFLALGMAIGFTFSFVGGAISLLFFDTPSQSITFDDSHLGLMT